MASATVIGDYRATRANLFSIEPMALHVDWSKNLSRNGEEPPVNDALKELALDMMPRTGDGESEQGTSGQLNPITVRKNSQGDHEVILGYRRMRAALWLVESGTCSDFRISYVIKSMNDAEAALVNMSENLQREDPEPIQTAHAIRRLTEDYGLPLSQVAGRLKKSITWCGNLLKLVSLPREIQQGVVDEEIGVTAAIELAKLPDAASQTATYNELREEGGRITTGRVQDKNPSEKAKGPLNKLKKFLEDKSMANEGGGTLAEMIGQFLTGEVKETELSEYWDSTFSFLTSQLEDRSEA